MSHGLSLRFRQLGWFAVLMLTASAVFGQMPTVSSGSLQRLENFSSHQVPSRNIDIWLPEGYSSQQKYAVLYMHDGQMLFDAELTWNRQEWRADEVAGELIATGRTRPFIIVGVWNGGERRMVEYLPQRAFEGLSPAQQQAQYALQQGSDTPMYAGKVDSDAYLRFLVEELKPYIDRHFSVLTGPADTAIMGSSMGGLISLYALSEYPDTFGAAACLSSHWPGSADLQGNPLPQALFDYIEAKLPAAGRHRLYFDHGTATLDALYPPLQQQVDVLVKAKGYSVTDWQTRVFEGAEHTEDAWSARLAIPMQFLFPVEPAPAADTDTYAESDPTANPAR